MTMRQPSLMRMERAKDKAWQMILQHAILLSHQWGKPVIQLRWWKILMATLMTRRNKGLPVKVHLEILTQSHQGLCLLVMCQHSITTFTKVLYKDFHLRWLKTVSSTFQDVDFDRSLLPLFISCCYNHVIKKLPNRWWTRWYYFRDTIGYHSDFMTC